MAERAALGLDGRVFVDKWAGGLDVAFGADRILGRANPQLVRLEGAMWVVAVAALQHPFIYRMMKGLSESWFYVSVAGIAELRLRNLQQACLTLRLMNTVATDAAYFRFAVSGALKIGVSACVAAEAFLINRLRSGFAEPEDLRCIPSGVDVSLTRSMTVFAGDAFVSVQQSHAFVGIC